ncbi:MAG: hypothetical protein PHI97_31515 [Desulfobulbus sp.]|nr:hypothetical protein [Desulfobulbus sp.]
MSIDKTEKEYQKTVLDMFKKLLGVKQDKEVAEIIGIIPEEMANRKRRGTLVQTLFAEAVKRKMDLNLLFYEKKNDEKIIIVKAEKENQKRKFEILDEAEEWLTEMVRRDRKREIWFEVEFEKTFQEFKKWKEAKEETETREDTTTTRKVA